MTISVCVGSSCHLKGSYDVIEILKKQIAERKLEDKAELKASFCLGNCADGVSVKVGEKLMGGFNAQNTEERFIKEILPEITK